MSKDYKTLTDARDFLIKQRVQMVDSALAQYIQSACLYVEHKDEKLEDYALIQINNPMHLKDDHSVTITQQWRLIPISELENAPEYGDD
jgi:hypothetical protein